MGKSYVTLIICLITFDLLIIATWISIYTAESSGDFSSENLRMLDFIYKIILHPISLFIIFIFFVFTLISMSFRIQDQHIKLKMLFGLLKDDKLIDEDIEYEHLNPLNFK